ncbi:GNAT family N-acetyltransferase [Yinghuangia soli]|uniref:GNAT family N-acetyltransferase n=1 Tax=Yinghuangia soli TaxID=2908204 RepID=A0AA41PYG4_9ACTN|nr:GNAT family N-acetyltransferase [Yinghuangia soli]MCF2527690.1 GNAT family N-acetyltransferase [Yinghuangia soli]
MEHETRVVVRQGGAELVDRLAPLWLALLAHHQAIAPDYAYQDPESSWKLRSTYYREWLAEPGSFVLLATVAEVPVGYALVHVKEGPSSTWAIGDRTAELETLSVAPDRRGQGIGTLLLDAVDDELSAAGIDDLFIGALAANTEALRLYERRGLRPIMVHVARLGSSRRTPGPPAQD